MCEHQSGLPGPPSEGRGVNVFMSERKSFAKKMSDLEKSCLRGLTQPSTPKGGSSSLGSVVVRSRSDCLPILAARNVEKHFERGQIFDLACVKAKHPTLSGAAGGLETVL